MFITLLVSLLFYTNALHKDGSYYLADEGDNNLPECLLANYLMDENQCHLGKSVCKNNCHCDGKRTCVNGCCTGWPRYANDTGDKNDNCLNPTFKVEENTQHSCQTSCDCDGNRFCTQYESCHGTARYQASCVSQGMNVTSQQANSVVSKNSSGSTCSCKNLLTQALDNIVTDKLAQDPCQKFIDDLQSKAISASCDYIDFCDFCLSTLADTVSEAIPYKTPFINMCYQFINVLQDFTGVDLKQIQAQGVSLFQNKVDQAAGVACGLVTCKNQCSSQVLNGVSFVVTQFEQVCDVVSSIMNNLSLRLTISWLFVLFLIGERNIIIF